MSELERSKSADSTPAPSWAPPAEILAPRPTVVDGEPRIDRPVTAKPTDSGTTATKLHDGEPRLGRPSAGAAQPVRDAGTHPQLHDGEPRIGKPASQTTESSPAFGDTHRDYPKSAGDNRAGNSPTGPAQNPDSPHGGKATDRSAAEATDSPSSQHNRGTGPELGSEQQPENVFAQQDQPTREIDADQPQVESDDRPKTTAADSDIVCDRDPSVVQPIDRDLEQRFAAYRQQLADEGRTRHAHEPGPAYDYQRQHCGNTEFRVSPDSDLPKAAWADGLNNELALAQDAKYIKVHGASSWFIPDTLHPSMAGLAERKMDDRLIKYRNAIESPDNPVRGLEIIVNRPEAAQFIAGRMNALGIPGIVRLRP